MPTPSRRPQHLLLVTHYYDLHRGGVEIVAGQLARGLAEIARTEAAGHDIENSVAPQDPTWQITWCASDVDGQVPADQAGLVIEPLAGWNPLERWGLPWPIPNAAALRTLARAVRAADVVHLHDYLYAANLWVYVLARLQRKPVLVTQHIGDIPYQNPVLRLVLRGLNRSLGRMVLAGAQQVVFISHQVQQMFCRGRNFRAPSLFWPNGVDTGIFQPVSPERRTVLRRHFLGYTGRDHSTLAPELEQRPVVLFVGRFVEKKGLLRLRQLAAARPAWQWWFAGWGEPVFDPRFWGMNHVQVFQGLRGTELAKLYQAADLLILPSVGEGFPLVVQEAMACGTPAMVSTGTAAAAPYLDETVLFRAPLQAELKACATIPSVTEPQAGSLDSAHGGRAAPARSPLAKVVDDQTADHEVWLGRLDVLLAGESPIVTDQNLRQRIATLAREHWAYAGVVQAYDAKLRQLADDAVPRTS